MSVRVWAKAATPRFLKLHWERLEASPLGYRLAKGAVWSLIGAVTSRGLGLVASIFVARMLGKEAFGELGIIQSTVGMFGTLAGFGLGVTATKHVAEFRERDPQRTGRILSLSAVVSWGTGLLATAALTALAPWLATMTLAAPQLTDELRIGSLLVLLGAVNGAQTGALAGFEAFKRIAQVNFWGGLVNFPCVTLGCLFYGLRGAVWGLAVGLAIGCVLNRWALGREAQRIHVPLWVSGWHSELSVVWSFGLPAMLAAAITTPTAWAVNALLVNQPQGYQQLGIFAAVQRISSLPDMLMGLLSAAFLPLLANTRAEVPNSDQTEAFSHVLRLSCALLLPFSLVQAAAPFLTVLPYGDQYAGHHTLVQWLMLGALVRGLSYPFATFLMSSGKAWQMFGFSALLSVPHVLLAFLLIPSYLAVGSAAAYSVAFLLANAALVVQAFRRHSAPLQRGKYCALVLLVSFLFVFCLLSCRFLDRRAALVVAAMVSAVLLAAVRRLCSGKEPKVRLETTCVLSRNEG